MFNSYLQTPKKSLIFERNSFEYMEIENYPSTLLEKAVTEFSKLPGVGKRTALRLVLHMLKQDKEDILNFSQVLRQLGENIHFCKRCNNVSDDELCNICSDSNRDQSIVCVVESVRDVMAIESTSQYHGIYHVLGGVISPMEGIGPNDLNVVNLANRVQAGDVKEVIMALPTTMEGDSTAFYIFRKIGQFDVRITSIARGIAFGDELQYADEITLGRSIVNRVEFTNPADEDF